MYPLLVRRDLSHSLNAPPSLVLLVYSTPAAAAASTVIRPFVRYNPPQLKAEASSTSSTLEDTRTALAREGAVRARLDSEVSALRLDRERDLRDLRAAHSAELTAAREDGVRRAEEGAAAKSSEVCVRVCVRRRPPPCM